MIGSSDAAVLAQQKVEILARIHAFEWGSAGLDSLRTPADAADSPDVEISHWESIMREEALEPQPALEMGLTWLKANKPQMLHLIITGRYAPQTLIEYADLVTEMREIKHPLKEQSIRAQAGIEY